MESVNQIIGIFVKEETGIGERRYPGCRFCDSIRSFQICPYSEGIRETDRCETVLNRICDMADTKGACQPSGSPTEIKGRKHGSLEKVSAGGERSE